MTSFQVMDSMMEDYFSSSLLQSDFLPPMPSYLSCPYKTIKAPVSVEKYIGHSTFSFILLTLVNDVPCFAAPKNDSGHDFQTES